MVTQFFVHVPAGAARNLSLGLRHSVWGWKDEALAKRNNLLGGATNRELAQRIREGDVIVFGHRGPDPRAEESAYPQGIFSEVHLAIARRRLYRDAQTVWPDELYPNRVDLEFIQSGKDWGAAELSRAGMAALRVSANAKGVPVPSDEARIPVLGEAHGLSLPGNGASQSHEGPPPWTIAPGNVLRRSEIHSRYGGSVYGGVEPSRTTPNVMIYTDPHAGESYGYVFDGWSHTESGVFYYCGHGQVGDQDPYTNRNAAILRHLHESRALRLFSTLDGKNAAPGGKRQQYVGEFRVDPEHPFEFQKAPDRNGDSRRVVVFRLLAIEADREGESASYSDLHFGGDVSVEAPTLPPPVATPAAADALEAAVDYIDSENHTVMETVHPPRAGHNIVKFEAKLVSEWEHRLRSQGHELVRARISIDGEKGDLVTDTLDLTAGILYEAKSSAERSTVRLALGQLWDYLRFLPGFTGSLLLTEEPTPDVRRLVKSAGFGLVYKKLGTWAVVSPSQQPVLNP